ncbi:MAG: outer membrane beta-barrel protein, partial [Bacteroidota bacterium]
MKHIKLLIIALLVACTSLAQRTIQGQVQEESGSKIPFANALLYSNTDSLLNTALTTINGSFKFETSYSDTLSVIISAVGYSKNTIVLPPSVENVNLEMITMSISINELDEATVSVEKPIIEVLPSKTVFNVSSSLTTIGETGLDLLRKAPGVLIDNNQSITVEGKTGAQVYINGRLSPLRGEDLTNFLKSLNSDDIESIEIITQPSAKYDAAGTAGIINIVLRREKGLGTQGSVSLGAGYGQKFRYNGGVNINHRSKKFNTFGAYSHNGGEWVNWIYLNRQQGNFELDAKSDIVHADNNHNVRFGIDSYLSDRSTVGVLVNGNFSDGSADGISRTPIGLIGTGVIDSILVADNLNESNSTNWSINGNYAYQDTIGNSLNVDLDWAQYQSDRAAFQPNQYFDASETTLLNSNNSEQLTAIEVVLMSAQLDYSTELFGGNLGAGAKATNVVTTNSLQFFNEEADGLTLDFNRSNRFSYDESVYAAYMTYGKKWKKWNAEFGVRMEATESLGSLETYLEEDLEDNKRSYVDWFPSGGITFQHKPMSSFALNYSRRIDRPNYSSLNPFEYQLDELGFRRGNPFLQPQYTHNLKLSHTYKYTLNTSVSYARV